MRFPTPSELQLLREAQDPNQIWDDATRAAADELIRIGWLVERALPEDDPYEWEVVPTKDGELAMRLAVILQP